MGEEEGGRRRSRSGEDLISGLPDEVLRCVLVRLRAAARTGVLSRRWRRVWAHLPELHLDGGLEALPPAPAVASFPDAVDGALAGCLAPALERLSIAASADDGGLGIPAAGRAAPWLRFAAGRVAGDLCLYLPPPPFPLPPGAHPEEAAELELPACGRAKAITLFPQLPWRLRPQPAGVFAALTALRLHCCRMEGGELSALVCTQCPRLVELSLSVTLVAIADVSIRSDSLLSLWLRVMNTQRLEVVAPRLEELTLSNSIQVHVSAPKLARLVWRGGAYDPPNHRFLDVGRRLWLLQIGMNSAAVSLMQQFDEVDVFKLEACIPQGTEGYERFLSETKRLPKCNTLSISLFWRCHGLTPAILHLLRSCNGTRKISLTLFHWNESWMRPCATSCPCSLDEIEISSYSNFHEDFEFVELLFRCNATALKKLLVNYKMARTVGETKEVCAKVRGMCRSNVEIEFYVFPNGPDGRRVRCA